MPIEHHARSETSKRRGESGEGRRGEEHLERQSRDLPAASLGYTPTLADFLQDSVTETPSQHHRSARPNSFVSAINLKNSARHCAIAFRV
ncbi:unnamed protein product [Calypogeia fissa]